MSFILGVLLILSCSEREAAIIVGSSKVKIENSIHVDNIYKSFTRIKELNKEKGISSFKVYLPSESISLDSTFVMDFDWKTSRLKVSLIGIKGRTILSGSKSVSINNSNGLEEQLLSMDWDQSQLFHKGQRIETECIPMHKYFVYSLVPSDSLMDNHIPLKRGVFNIVKDLDLKFTDIEIVNRWEAGRYKIDSVFTEKLVYKIDRENRSLIPFIKSNKIGITDTIVFRRHLMAIKNFNLNLFKDDTIKYRFLRKESLYKEDNQSNISCEDSDLQIPTLEKLVKIKSTFLNDNININFKNISFTCTANHINYDNYPRKQAAHELDASVEISKMTNVVFDSCYFSQIGKYAVWFKNKSNYCTITNSDFEDLGAGAIKIGDLNNNDVKAITIENCKMRKGGVNYPHAVAIWIGDSPGNKVVNNYITDFTYSGISVGWTWGYKENNAENNLIEGNHIHDIGYGPMDDLGAIYTLGRQENTMIRNNIIYNISSFGDKSFGIYADEGSSEIIIENNVIHSCKGAGFHLHFGENITLINNIIAYNQKSSIKCSGTEPFKMLNIHNNIIVTEHEFPYEGPWEYIWADMYDNCYWNEKDSVISFSGGRNLAEWQAYHRDEGSVVSNPDLVFSIQKRASIGNDKVIRQIGFRNIK